MRDKRIVHIPDVLADPDYTHVGYQRSGDYRTLLAIPMLREGEPIGTFVMTRQAVRPFNQRQIELVKTFADQAVIAIENARLLSELRKSLEQQTATADVLRVISSSPGDLEPVFSLMLEKAAQICDASYGNIYRWDGEALHYVASHNTPEALVKVRKDEPLRPEPTSPLGIAITTKSTWHTADLSKDPAYVSRSSPSLVAGVELGGIRANLFVPMLKEGELVGMFSLFRNEARAFSDKQIDLVKNLAAQAVIAIENARLLSELRESLAQQIATAEVLRVISSSPGDLEPVFNSILENATRICGASFGNLELCENGMFRIGAMFNAPTAFVEHRRREPFISPHPLSALARVVETKRFFQVENLPEHPAYKDRFPPYVHLVEGAGARTLLIMPLLKEDELVGVLGIYRQEVVPFTDKQIALVQNFAGQAVIAIENTRLLSELRKSLEQQTATADVLRVISSSPGDLQPVFAKMLESAARICEANFGSLALREGDAFRRVVLHNAPPEFVAFNERSPLFDVNVFPALAEIASGKEAIHITDLQAEGPNNPLVRYGGARTLVVVPLVKADAVTGIFGIYRQEVRPFSEKQIELLRSFAAQAVIAIENARLLSELRARTDELGRSVGELRALGEVSQAVNSTLDLENVLETIVAKAVQLSDTEAGAIYVFDDVQPRIPSARHLRHGSRADRGAVEAAYRPR